MKVLRLTNKLLHRYTARCKKAAGRTFYIANGLPPTIGRANYLTETNNISFHRNGDRRQNNTDDLNILALCKSTVSEPCGKSLVHCVR
jgi:hypothetical protein